MNLFRSLFTSLLTFTTLLVGVNSYSSGVDTCMDTPGHGSWATGCSTTSCVSSAGSTPFLALDIIPTLGTAPITSYIPNHNYSVILRVSQANGTTACTTTTCFRGFILTAGVSSTPTSFISVSSAPVGLLNTDTTDTHVRKMSSCAGLTHNSATSVHSIRGLWIAPPIGTGTVSLKAVVVTTKNGLNYNVQTVLGEQVATVSPTQSPIQSPNSTRLYVSMSGTPLSISFSSSAQSTITSSGSTTAQSTNSLTPTYTPQSSITSSGINTPQSSITSSGSITAQSTSSISNSNTPQASLTASGSSNTQLTSSISNSNTPQSSITASGSITAQSTSSISNSNTPQASKSASISQTSTTSNSISSTNSTNIGFVDNSNSVNGVSVANDNQKIQFIVTGITIGLLLAIIVAGSFIVYKRINKSKRKIPISSRNVLVLEHNPAFIIKDLESQDFNQFKSNHNVSRREFTPTNVRLN